jgi:hypothetical protein
MESQFDIFRAETDGNMLWRGAAASLNEAKARVQEIAKTWPADYVIVNLQSGLRIKISMDGTAGSDGHGGASGSTDGTPQTPLGPDC